MTRRELLPAGLLALAVASDAVGVDSLAFYAMLGAIPALVVAGLATLEDVVREDCSPLRRLAGLVQAVSLVLVVAAAAIRAPLRAEGTVPSASASALVAALCLLGVQLVVSGLAVRRSGHRHPLDGVPGEPELAEAA